MDLPITKELIGLEEQHGADRRLIEPAGLEEGGHRRLGGLEITRGQVNLSQTPIGQGDVDLHKQEDAGEPAFLAKTGLGPFGSGDSAPNLALLLGQLPPAGGDSPKIAADGHLSRGTRVARDEGRIAIGAIAVALPNCISAFPRPDIGHFHINYATFTIKEIAYQKCRHLSSLESQPGISDARVMQVSCKCKFLLCINSGCTGGNRAIRSPHDVFNCVQYDAHYLLDLIATFMAPPAPKVFMSYSHDTEMHKDWVLKLATRLVANGANRLLDTS